MYTKEGTTQTGLGSRETEGVTMALTLDHGLCSKRQVP